MTSLALKHYIKIGLFIGLVILQQSPLQAQSLKQMLLMPGDLTAKHEQYEPKCENCHSDFDRSKQVDLCLDCHEEISTDINQKGGFHGLNKNIAAMECKECHTDHKGRDFNIVGLDTETFNHEHTNFPLRGQHDSAACADCHNTDVDKRPYRIAEFQCLNCHEEQNPHGDEFDNQCDSCHNAKSWGKISFDHDNTDFQLKFSHRDIACDSCHINQNFVEIDQQCNDCHAKDDVHQQRFGTACADCHNEKKWAESMFDHDKDTDFELLFGHKLTSCNNCHKESTLDHKPKSQCIDCHSTDDIHNGTQGDQCDQCHTSERWSKNQFDHNKETDFPLEGEHINASCNGCHSPQQGNEVAGDQCVDCHKLADPHDNSLGNKCEQCHNVNGWKTSLFSHQLVKFPLIGVHRQLACEECHIDTNYSDTENTCVECHKGSDIHKGALGSECEQCHNPNDWGMWLFNHDTATSYPLEGAHRDLQCSLCHKDSKGPNQQCVSCHREDDVHRGSFGRHCQQCHSEDTFSR